MSPGSAPHGDLPEMDALRECMRQLDFQGAQYLAEKAAEGYLKAGKARGLAWCQYHQAEIAFELGAFAQAQLKSDECLKAFAALGDKAGQAWALCNIQRSICLLGQPEASLMPGKRALNLFVGLGDREGVPLVKRWVGVAEQKLGHLQDAKRSLYEAMHGFIRLGSAARFLECVHDLSWIEIDAQRPAEALRLQQYLIRHPETPRWAAINVMASLGRLSAQQERLPEYAGTIEELIMMLI